MRATVPFVFLASAAAGCSPTIQDDPRMPGCNGSFYQIGTTTGEGLSASVVGACVPPICNDGSICYGYFSTPGSSCSLVVTLAGMGSCTEPIQDPGCNLYVDVVAMPSGGAVSCSSMLIGANGMGL
jgi:hypothetical protein